MTITDPFAAPPAVLIDAPPRMSQSLPTRQTPLPTTCRPLLPGGQYVVDSAWAITADGKWLQCPDCKRDGRVVCHVVTMRIQNDRKGVRALKTAGYIAASTLLYGRRKRQWRDVDVTQIECLDCHAMYIETIEEHHWISLSEDERAAFKNATN